MDTVYIESKLYFVSLSGKQFEYNLERPGIWRVYLNVFHGKRMSEFMGHDDLVHRNLYDYCHVADLESLRHAHSDGMLINNLQLDGV